MFPRLASTAFVAGTLLTALMPAAGFAQDRRGNSGAGRSTRSSGGQRSGGSREFSARGGGDRGSSRGQGQRFVSPRGNDGARAYSGGSRFYSRGYIAPRSYGRPVYRGYYGPGIYLGYSAPYGYAYDPGPAYDPAYSSAYSYGSAPAPQTCAPGSYDRNGTWIPNPNCYPEQQQYSQPQQNYNYDQQQYPQQQQNYDPNQQPYPQTQQPYYDPNPPQRYGR